MLGVFFLEQKIGVLGFFFSGAENRRAVGVFFGAEKSAAARL